LSSFVSHDTFCPTTLPLTYTQSSTLKPGTGRPRSSLKPIWFRDGLLPVRGLPNRMAKPFQQGSRDQARLLSIFD
jgi:hypothetical protein